MARSQTAILRLCRGAKRALGLGCDRSSLSGRSASLAICSGSIHTCVSGLVAWEHRRRHLAEPIQVPSVREPFLLEMDLEDRKGEALGRMSILRFKAGFGANLDRSLTTALRAQSGSEG
jgi:hypothetical protein